MFSFLSFALRFSAFLRSSRAFAAAALSGSSVVLDLVLAILDILLGPKLPGLTPSKCAMDRGRTVAGTKVSCAVMSMVGGSSGTACF